MKYLIPLVFLLVSCEFEIKSNAFNDSKSDKLAKCLKHGIIELDQDLKENQKSTGMIKACLFVSGYKNIVHELRGK